MTGTHTLQTGATGSGSKDLDRFSRRAALGACACAVVLFTGGFGAAPVRASSVESVPGAVSLITKVFTVDTNAQLDHVVTRQTSDSETGVATASMTPSVAAKFTQLVNSDRENVARGDEARGRSLWDRGSTSVVVESQRRASSASWILEVDVEQAFHIAGSNAASPADDESRTATRYDVTVSRVGGALHITNLKNLEPETAPQPVAGAPAQPISAPSRISYAQAIAELNALGSHISTATTARRRATATRPRARAHAAGAYNWNAAREYMYKYWHNANPAYASYENDCQNFVSQAITAGGEPWFGSTEGDWFPAQYPWYNAVGFYGFARSKGSYYRFVGFNELGSGDEIELYRSGSSVPNHAVAVDDYGSAENEFYVASHTESRWHYPLRDELKEFPSLTLIRPLYG